MNSAALDGGISWVLVREWVSKAWVKSVSAARWIVLSIRPRVSSFTGGVFVLLTLLLPIAYNSCDPCRTGLEFVRGESGNLPLVAGLGFESFQRGFYVFTLVFAVIPLALVLLSWLRPRLFRGRRLVTGLYAVAGTVWLYILGDAICFFLSGLVVGILETALRSSDTRRAAGVGLIFLVTALCLRSKFLRSLRVIFALLTAAIAACALLMTDYFAPLFRSRAFLPNGAFPSILIIFISNLYWFVPAYLWYRYGLLRRSGVEAQWLRIRTTIVKVYLPGLFCIPFLFWLAANEGVWGFIPYSIGIHLMSLGYMRLARRVGVEHVGENVPVSVLSPSPS